MLLKVRKKTSQVVRNYEVLHFQTSLSVMHTTAIQLIYPSCLNQDIINLISHGNMLPTVTWSNIFPPACTIICWCWIQSCLLLISMTKWQI